MGESIALKGNLSQEEVARLIQSSLGRLKPETLRSYTYALNNFAEYCNCSDPGSAMHMLLSKSRGEANFFVLEYLKHLQDQGFSPSTVNARLAAIRGRVADARMVGLVDYQIDVKSPKRETLKDVRGPTEAQFQRILRYVKNPTSKIEHRTRAIVYMLAFMALRRNEIVSLDVEDVDVHRKQIMVLRKGKNVKEPKSVPSMTMVAISEWINISGLTDGPLFINYDPTGKGSNRYSATSLYRMIRKIGDECSIKNLHPHAFRHFSITEALDVTGGSTRKAQKHSGHTDARMIDVYEDERRDEALEVANSIERKWIK